ncbi:MAG TPA: Flp family type IVb pilin [Armatimonadota bacterium]|nr:Flp family type IVb pilin [Armatimonadota bacterium]
MERIKRLFKDEEGATMVEYALMLALIAVVCIALVTTLGTAVRDKFGYVGGKIEASPEP